MFGILKKLGKEAVSWDSTFSTGMKIPPNAIVHDYEGGSQTAAKVRQVAYKLPSNCLQITHCCLILLLLLEDRKGWPARDHLKPVRAVRGG